MERHIRIVGILYIALGVFGVLVALILFFAITISGKWAAPTNSATTMATAAAVALSLLLLMSALGIIGGVGLLRRRAWARPLAIVLAALNLFSFPLGTAVGIYALWVMLKPETQQLLATPRRDAWAH
ncbi:MAG: hypothetical protein AB7U82_08455 [Blastocatellales bacterium]